ALVRRKPCLERPAAGSQLLRFVLGLSRMDGADGDLLHHHHRLGLGLCRAGALDLPQRPGHAAAGRVQGHGTAISLARYRLPAPERADHPDSLGVALDDALAAVADRARGAERLRKRVSLVHLRSRTEPSCATEATSVPSGLKISPRVRPRPP